MAVYAKATYEYEAADPGDLTFDEGDIIEVLEQAGEWWRGRIQNREGYFPFNRVRILRNNPYKGKNKNHSNVVAFGNNPAERVSRITVELADRKGSRNGRPTYKIGISLKTGEQMRGVKTMHDVRLFDRALKNLSPGYSFKSELPPEWADMIPLSAAHCRDRAALLEKYFNKNQEERQLFDLISIRWCKANKNQLRSASPKKQAQIMEHDTKPNIEAKIGGALSEAYQKESKDPSRWFFGREKVGNLAQCNYKWDARDNTEISFSANDYILVSSKETQFEGWWYGQKIAGSRGFFPSNYVIELDEATVKKRLKPRTTKTAPIPTSINGGFNSPFGNTGPVNGPSSPMFQTPNAGRANAGAGTGRDRRIEKNFWVKSIEAYDELKTQGYTLEQEGRHMKSHQSGAVKNGDMVSLSFSAYVWDPQTQQLREFSASDNLKAPPAGVESGNAGKSGFKMEFVVGTNTAIEGLEQVVPCLQANTPVRAILSPSMGYGEVGSPPEIPADCYLVYDLTLEKVTSGSNYRPPRTQVFSVGITRTNIQKRDAATSGAVWASKRFGNNAPTQQPTRRKKKRGGRPTDI